MKSPAGAVAGMRSEVGEVLGFLSQLLATSGFGGAPRRVFTGPMRSRSLVSRSDFAALSLASCFFRYSDFTASYLGSGHAFLNGVSQCHIRLSYLLSWQYVGDDLAAGLSEPSGALTSSSEGIIAKHISFQLHLAEPMLENIADADDSHEPIAILNGEVANAPLRH
jgi:hypothetical protein